MKKIKHFILLALLILLILGLLLFSSSNIVAAKKGLTLWFTSIVPSLFPFFVATELLSKTEIPYFLGKALKKFMIPLFNVRGEGAFVLIMGFISGYPVGAKIITNFRNSNILSKEECERLLSFTNNSGPLFILGTIGISMYGSSLIGLLLLFSHFFASITVGLIFRFWKINSPLQNVYDKHYNKKTPQLCFSNLGEIISISISNATSTIIMICGFIIIFSVLISILHSFKLLSTFTILISPLLNIFHIPSNFTEAFATGLFEITNGISLISSIKIKAISLNIILTSIILGFGGLSVLLQIWSIISKSDLSIKPYIYGKFLQSIFSAIYTAFFIAVFPFFNLNI